MCSPACVLACIIARPAAQIKRFCACFAVCRDFGEDMQKGLPEQSFFQGTDTLKRVAKSESINAAARFAFSAMRAASAAASSPVLQK